MSKRKAAVYARYSSEAQSDGNSIEGQLSAIEAYTKHNDIIIVETYIDRAKSATTDNRPAFQEMIKASGTGLFDTIIVHKLDRFARSKYDSAIYKHKLKVNKVQLLSVTENLDGSAESVILESVLEGMAQYYSMNLARETRKGQLENAKKAEWNGGKPPLGYDVVNKKLVINEREAESVKIAFEMRAAGYGYYAIIDRLNEAGYLTKYGNKFGKNSLYEILRNEKYTGVYIFNRSSAKTPDGKRNNHNSKADDEIIRIEGGCPMIVSKELFDKATERYRGNKDAKSRYANSQKYLLSGVVFCGYCGMKMHANKRRGGTEQTFRCTKMVQTKDCKCKEINMQQLDRYVLNTLKENFFSYHKAHKMLDMVNDYYSEHNGTEAEQIKDYQLQLVEINATQDNIISAIENGVSQEHFADKLDDLKIREETIKAKLNVITPTNNIIITKKDVLLLVNKFNQLLSENDICGLKKFILDFVKEVTVTNDRVRVTLKISLGSMTLESKLPSVAKTALKKAAAL